MVYMGEFEFNRRIPVRNTALDRPVQIENIIELLSYVMPSVEFRVQSIVIRLLSNNIVCLFFPVS